MEAAGTAEETASNLKRKNFRQDNDIVQHLINSLLQWKPLTTYSLKQLCKLQLQSY